MTVCLFPEHLPNWNCDLLLKKKMLPGGENSFLSELTQVMNGSKSREKIVPGLLSAA